MLCGMVSNRLFAWETADNHQSFHFVSICGHINSVEHVHYHLVNMDIMTDIGKKKKNGTFERFLLLSRKS